MRLLILGGTRFLGRHLAEQAIAAGHDVTLMHRGRSGPGLVPEARHLVADRNGDLSLLACVLAEGPGWDAAIDTNAYVPRHVRSVGAVLAGRVSRYLLVSTISVYSNFADPGQDEEAPLQQLADPTVETVTGETYGGLKVLCEEAAYEAFGRDAVLIARPGLIVGPHDPTERFTWWLRRLQRGGELLAPAPPEAPLQFIDARDAAAWLLLQVTTAGRGTYNLTGPSAEPLTMAGFLAAAAAALESAPRTQPVWASEEFLIAQGVQPWSDLPLWVRRSEAGLHQLSIRRALDAGLRCRPLAQTVLDTAAWAQENSPPAAASQPPGLSAAREAALIGAWLKH